LSKDTWTTDSGNVIAIGDLVDECRRFKASGVDGITISGGEPFEQSEALESMLTGLHVWSDNLATPVDYLCYSGKPFEAIQSQYSSILSLLDTIVPEPYIEELSGKPLRGSSNQPIIHLTELGATRFEDYMNEVSLTPEKRMQFRIENDGSVSFIGIPERGDMQKLSELCKVQGLYLNNVSWG
jgi:anaerobic ribonucleoside-triphosphate reductase activating protein